MNSIYVFSSDLGGRHLYGTALEAVQNYGAIYFQGAGLQGRSYGIPTRSARQIDLPLWQLEIHVKRFLSYAAVCDLRKMPVKFEVTPIGCGMTHYRAEQVAPMFARALELPNVILPEEFLEVLNND